MFIQPCINVIMPFLNDFSWHGINESKRDKRQMARHIDMRNVALRNQRFCLAIEEVSIDIHISVNNLDINLSFQSSTPLRGVSAMQIASERRATLRIARLSEP